MLWDLSRGQRSDAIKKALLKAQDVARERPVSELIKECKEFMERSTRRIAKLKSELEAETGLLEQSRARLARLEVQQAAPVRDSVVRDGPQVSSLQQMVIQLQAERDSLSQELRRSRGPHARPCGDGPPNVSDIPPLPDQAQDVEQWMNARNFDLRDALEFGSLAVISHRVKSLGARSCKIGFIPHRWGCARSQRNGGTHRTRGSDVGVDLMPRMPSAGVWMSQLLPCDQAQEFLSRVEGNESRRGISNPGPRDSPGSTVPPHRRLRLIRASQGGVESSAREVPSRAGSQVSPPSTVHVSSREREVRGGEEDFLDLEEDLLATRGHRRVVLVPYHGDSTPQSVQDVEPHSLPFTGTTVPAVTGELRNLSQHQVSVMDMTANDSDLERGSVRGNRFATLSDHDSEDDSGSDTITLNGASDVEIGEVVEHTADSEPVCYGGKGPSSGDSIFQFGFSESDGGVHQPSTLDAFSARHVERGVPVSAPGGSEGNC